MPNSQNPLLEDATAEELAQANARRVQEFKEAMDTYTEMADAVNKEEALKQASAPPFTVLVQTSDGQVTLAKTLPMDK